MVENIGNTPTFDNGRWNNIIDLSITNAKGHNLVSKWHVHVVDKVDNSSDHNFINFKISAKEGIQTSRFRDIAKTDWRQYQENLDRLMESSATEFENLNDSRSIDKAANTLMNITTKAFNDACTETFVSSKIKSPPWETKAVREAKNTIKHKLRCARNTKADKDWGELRSHQAQYKKLVKNARISSWRDFCKDMDSKSNPKKISTILKNEKNTKLGTVRKPDGSLTESPEETLETMANTHFKTDGPMPTASGKRPDEAENMNTINSNPNQIFSERRIKKALAEFDSLTAAGPDGIRPIMLQKGWDSIATAFTNIAKASFASSHTPECWRQSSGIFLPKPGKSDYFHPKAYRTITLSPVPLKLMERVVLWHMEVDLKIYSKLNKKQYGFLKGRSTETALHKLVNKIEKAIINSGMALGTFLDIEGAFDNVSFSAIERALDNKCESKLVNRWIMGMIETRTITVELNGSKKTIQIKRGCPQGGILSPFLWNLVVDSLLSFTKNKIPCDMQGFADDLALLATLELSRSGDRGFDADTLREVTQKSLDAIEEWCKESGLQLSVMKTHSVMFTWKRKWNFTKPLKVNGTEIEIKNSTKFLGVILDSKLSWNDHIETQSKKAKGILMQCRRVVGPTWGVTPETMKWIYTAIIRPMLSYAAVVWINGMNTNRNKNLLGSVQRLSNIMVTGALPSTSRGALDKITNLDSIELHIKQQAAKGALRLRADNTWDNQPIVSSRGKLISHIKINNDALGKCPFNGTELDAMTTELNLDNNFSVDIPSRDNYGELLDAIEPATIQCYTDGSKMDGRVGAGTYISSNGETLIEESFYLGKLSTVFQAEVTAVERTASILLERGLENQNIIIHCDSQAAIMDIDKTKVKSKTTIKAIGALNRLGEGNQVLLRWIPAHNGYDGNEKADSLAKRGSTNSNSTPLYLPTPKVTWNGYLESNTRSESEKEWKNLQERHIKLAWREKFYPTITKLKRDRLRLATHFLTGHAALNYHLNKFKPLTIPKTCPHCKMEDETVTHFMGRCPKWSAMRGAYFNTFYTNISDIADNNTLNEIVNYINATKRLVPWQK